MAEVIYNARARKSFARSSGFSLSGFPASDLAIETARKHDLDLNNHLSQSTDKTIVEWADIILCMTSGHKNMILNYFPKANVYTLYEYALGIQRDIIDPFGESAEVYEKVFEELEELIIHIVK